MSLIEVMALGCVLGSIVAGGALLWGRARGGDTAPETQDDFRASMARWGDLRGDRK